MDSEWTREGSLKSNLRVDADGDLNRYLQECMMVHDEWTVDTVNLGGTAGVLALVPFLLLGLGQELFLL